VLFINNFCKYGVIAYNRRIYKHPACRAEDNEEIRDIGKKPRIGKNKNHPKRNNPSFTIAIKTNYKLKASL
jgi:hypothetical protein